MNHGIQHPGTYVRHHVIPIGMNVKEAAAIIEVSRPTLSNLLNGNANLSPEMAARLERAFGTPARKLLDLQSEWDAAHANANPALPSIKAYVPPFLQFKAAQIETWADSGIAPRHRLSVFLRTLVHSTGSGLSKTNFPGNDDSERPGWDGEVMADQATPWIPKGRSGWEFGVNVDVLGKANKDFAKSVAAVPPAERKAMTFIFVTPRGWKGKEDWAKAQKAKKLWRDVRTYDASDLEQWLEQSLPGQTWFAGETGQDGHGTMSLDKAWSLWAADCTPPLSPLLFADGLHASDDVLKKAVSGDTYEPTFITADSKDEAVAFLSAAFGSETELAPYRDRIIVFLQPGPLSKLASQVSNFIPVIMCREVEKEFAPYRQSMPSFIIYPRNARIEESNIALDTASSETLSEALTAMGLDRDRIQVLARESGGSLTVLRRRLSRMPAIRTPDWASDTNIATGLIPFLYAGAWRSDNEMDRAMLEALAGDVPYEELDRRLTSLLLMDGTPVWSAGGMRGVVSKIDLLYAIGHTLTPADLERFFEVAELVLDERNPALDLPETDRWKANLFGKTRAISGPLRNGIAETMVLLSVYGANIFRGRHSFDASTRAERLVQTLLTPLREKLESQIDNLSLYAEAAPEVFLSVIEADLATRSPVTLELMRPIADVMFSGTPRSGLLWALEGLAWSNTYFLRVVRILGQLAERKINDNVLNKPTSSLSGIFRCWRPQTSASLPARKAAFEVLVRDHPNVAWPIAIEQLASGPRMAFPNHKPRWRPDGRGADGTLTWGEIDEFALFVFDKLVKWPNLTLEMAGDLLGILPQLDESLQHSVWDRIDSFADSATEEHRAHLREKIRVSAMTRRARKRAPQAEGGDTSARAKATYDRLEPVDQVLRYAWLFKTAWVDESVEELAAEAHDYKAREARITQLREDAVRAVVGHGGVAEVIRLAESGKAANHVGTALAAVMSDDNALRQALVDVLEGGEMPGARAAIVSGALWKAKAQGRPVFDSLLSNVREDKILDLLFAAPFEQTTWDAVVQLGADIDTRYWQNVLPNGYPASGALAYAVTRLMTAERPRVAFSLAHFDLEQLPAKVLYDLLVALAKPVSETDQAYRFNPHDLTNAFEILNAAGEIGEEALAALEFQFIEIFDRHSGRPINLERQIEAKPEWFVQAVTMAFRRRDGRIDAEIWDTGDEAQKSARAMASFQLLQNLHRIPGHLPDGSLDADVLVSWIEAVRAGCGAMGRQEVGDQMIGQLLSHAPEDEDGVWPCAPVRDALERTLTDHIERGLTMGLFNSRGAVWRRSGGGQERALAEKYGQWATALEYTHHRVCAVLRSMERKYLRHADREDEEQRIERRLSD